MVRRSLIAALAAAALIGSSYAPAFAVSGDHSDDTTIANVQVTTAIVMSGLTPAFTLNGVPGAQVTGLSAVTMVVTTNNLAGYNVTVQSEADTLAATAVNNGDAIPIGNLGVREHTGGTGAAYTAMSSGTPVTVHTQATRSALAGDRLVNDYQVQIPFVNEDTYSATLDYIAITL